MSQPRHLERIWIAALLLAWAADQFFFGHPAGLSFPVWTLLAILGLFYSAFAQDKRPAPASYLLAGLTLCLSVSIFVRSEPFTRGLSVLLSLGGLALLAATLLNGNWLFYRFGDYCLAALRLAFAALLRGAGIRLGAKPEAAAEPAPAAPAGARFWQNIRKAFPVLRGLLLAGPIVLVLGSLLASADPVFEQYISNFLHLFFDFEKLPEYIFRFFYILVFAYIFTGLFLHAALPEALEKRPSPDQPWNTRFLGSTESFIILGSVLALFAFFIALQARYLFGGQANIQETGFTYAEYARRGFFELVWVAVLSFGLYLTLSAVTRRESAQLQRIFRFLAVLLFAFVLVMLASALQRLTLYEAAYGFTRLRTYTHIFIPWLGVLLLAAIVLEILQRPGRIGLAFLVTALGFGLTFNLLSVDNLIARLNLERARGGAELDSSHLSSLSDDAVPLIAAAYSGEKPGELRDKLGKALVCHWNLSSSSTSDYRPGWRSYNLSAAQAALAYSKLDLSAYQISDAEVWEICTEPPMID